MPKPKFLLPNGTENIKPAFPSAENAGSGVVNTFSISLKLQVDQSPQPYPWETAGDKLCKKERKK
jgi:hypothetical protein